MGAEPFSKILEAGANVDPIFRTQKPLDSFSGSNPLFSNDPDLLHEKITIYEKALELMVADCPFSDLLEQILNVAVSVIPCETGSFFEVDHQRDSIFFRAVAGQASDLLKSFTIPKGQGIVGFVCETQSKMVLSNMDETSVHLASISASVGFEAKTLLAFPVVIHGRSFGCIELFNKQTSTNAPVFNVRDEELLATICHVASKVIENRILNAEVGDVLMATNEFAQTLVQAA